MHFSIDVYVHVLHDETPFLHTDLLPCNELISENGLDDAGETVMYLHQASEWEKQSRME